MKTRFLQLTIAVIFAIATTWKSGVSIAQSTYPFINIESNTLHFDSASSSIQHMVDRWQQVTSTGQGNFNIVHIGSSHVQAGMFTNTIRCDLLAAHPQQVGGRGMAFPYSAAAACNNPADYHIHCPQKVSLTRNVFNEYPTSLGLCGIAITTTDTLTTIQVALDEPRIDYATSRIVIIGHSSSPNVPLLDIEGRTVYPSYVDKRTDRFIYNLTHPTDSFTIILNYPPDQPFTLSGLLLDNRHPGISYHSIGVNGAAVPDYLRCTHFVRDLRLLHPDLVVFGIGINDAVPSTFDTAEFRRNYMMLIDSVRSVNPECAFIFVTNNDSFIKKGRNKYINNANGALARDVFYRLAQATGGAVWDQYEIMGGAKSMDKWRKAGLAKTDRVHFTTAGYQLVGHMFSESLLRLLDTDNNKLQTQPRAQYHYISY